MSTCYDIEFCKHGNEPGNCELCNDREISRLEGKLLELVGADSGKINKLYEYVTREYPYDTPGRSQAWLDTSAMEKEGWQLAWRDITLEGIFAVYRRQKVQYADTACGKIPY